jgi:hypothetical protein
MSKNYVAVLANDVVTTIFVADYEWAQANLSGVLHDLGSEPLTVGIGYIYDAVNDVFVAPEVSEVVE